MTDKEKTTLKQLAAEGFKLFKTKYHIKLYEKDREIVIYNTETDQVVKYNIGEAQ